MEATTQFGLAKQAIEAAQDSESRVSPEDAEKALIEENRRAGGVAYQFDPDASPEQKRVQVESTIPSDFHHKREHGAIGVATDIVNGATPGEEKPSESPERQGAHRELTEEERWARDRTGWAPRFHRPEDGMDEGDTLLDHQTYLETKLDDKFFGDWYHNAGIIVFACLSSWVVAVIGGGLGWLFIVMAFCGTYYRTSIRRVRRNFRDDINREMAKARLETDTESLEWINSFLVKFWPIYGPVLSDTIINSVDQVLSTATPAFLDSLRMKTFILGTKPPRLEHVKTYPKTEVDTVLMDWKFSFTPTDTMDMTARQLLHKTNPKVVLEVRVGKGVVSKGLDVIVEDFAFSGLMRVKVKLQIPFPHIERVDISFLGQPEIDYVCKPLGGDHLGFDINIIPGLESFIKDQIHGNLEPMMYAPNVFPVEIAKMLAGSPIDQAIGVVAVTIHGAHNLKNADRFSGAPDPYAAVSVNRRTILAKTRTVYDTSTPKWNETLYIIITSFTDALTLQVYDWNEYRKDKELGTASFPMETLEKIEEHENLTLELMASGRQRGLIQADIRFFPVLKGKKTETGEDEPAPESNTGIAKITLEQAKDLDGTRSLVGQLSPYGVLLLNGKEIHITNKLKRTNNPIFQNPSKEILITDRKTARLGMMIKDDRDLATDPILGTYKIKLNDMLRMMEKGQEWFSLSGAKTGRAKMKVEWKPVALKGVIGNGGYVTPIGVMRIHIQSARNLRNVETMGKSDPYVRVLLSGIEMGRTVTWQNNLNPDFDEVVYVPMHSSREKIILQVLDEENIGRDRPLGTTELSASDYIREGEDGEFEVDDEKQPMSSGLRLDARSSVKGTLNYTVAFYPTLNVIDPEEEEEDEKTRLAMESRTSLEGRGSVDSSRKSAADLSRPSIDSARVNGRPNSVTSKSRQLSNGEGSDGDQSPVEEKAVPKIRITPQDLHNYESGLLVFKIMEGQLAHSDVHVEVLMDDHVFPAYTSSKARTRHAVFNEIGDAFIRELEFSRITLRLSNKTDRKGDEDNDHIIAKLAGPTLPTLQQCLYKPTELTLRSEDGAVSKVTVSLKYLPVKMKLDPSESINNMGTLRVDVLDAADLPSADRNGYSDPYCKFKLDSKDIFKTKVQKKTLHPAWNEFFESPIKSRIGQDFRVEVYDWDFGDKADHLGGATIDITALEPFRSQEVSIPLDGKSGAIRLKLLFKPDYIIRSRQGSSTFSGTFAAPGRIVGAPVKTVGLLGGGVVKGASFLKHNFMRIRGDSKEDDAVSISGDATPTNGHIPSVEVTGTPQRAPQLGESTPPPAPSPTHSRSRSTASQIGGKLGLGPSSAGGETGTSVFTIVSTTGYPASTNVRVIVKQATSKGWKEVHKTKAMKAHSSGSTTPTGSSGSMVQFDQSHETFRINNATPDAQYQLQVKDHATFGSDQVLGEALLFVDDQGSTAGRERNVKVGNGYVTIKSTYTASDNGSIRPGTSHSTSGGNDEPPGSPDSRKPRRSFLSKRVVSGAGGSG